MKKQDATLLLLLMTHCGGDVLLARNDPKTDATAVTPATDGSIAPAADAGSVMPPPDASNTSDAPLGLRHGAFKILVISTTLEYFHDSIPTCLQMLKDLGTTSDTDLARIGAPPGSNWTVDVATPNCSSSCPDAPKQSGYLAEITAETLKNYELVYSNNPTGHVFSYASDGATKKRDFENYWNGGGSWAGQHAATDFENNNTWTWFQDNVNGAYLNYLDPSTPEIDPDQTAGTIAWEANYAGHSILKGLASPWSVKDEWFIMNRNVETVPGFQVIAKVTVPSSTRANGTTPRPAIWIKENPAGGRAFYTIRGHHQRVYMETEFRELMLRGILWAVHRLQ